MAAHRKRDICCHGACDRKMIYGAIRIADTGKIDFGSIQIEQKFWGSKAESWEGIRTDGAVLQL